MTQPQPDPQSGRAAFLRPWKKTAPFASRRGRDLELREEVVRLPLTPGVDDSRVTSSTPNPAANLLGFARVEVYNYGNLVARVGVDLVPQRGLSSCFRGEENALGL